MSFSVTAPFAGAFSPLVILLASSGSGSVIVHYPSVVQNYQT